MPVHNEEPTGQSYTRGGDVTGEDDLKMRYSRTTDFRPRRIHAEYRVRDGSWFVSKIVVSGPRVLKNGQVSETSQHANHYTPWWNGEVVPAWAMDFATSNTPAEDTIIS